MSSRRSYAAVFKLEVIAYAEEHGNCDAGRKFDLNEATVRGWRKRKEHIQSLPPKKKADRGTNNKYPKLESELVDWVTETRETGIVITTANIRLKAKELAKNKHRTFEASQNWCRRFMKRKQLSVRRRTDVAQKLPIDRKERLVRFHKFIIKMRGKHNSPLSLIEHAELTPLTFETPGSTNPKQNINAKC